MGKSDYLPNNPDRNIAMRSAPKITWPLAKAPDGTYAHIQDAVRGGLYYCPECSARFVARKGDKVRWHFAHYPGAVCTGEGSRHAIAKHHIALILKQPMAIPLRCGCAGLPTKPQKVVVSDVAVETSVSAYRVDVTCKLDNQLLSVEVIDAHRTPEEKLEHLKDALIEVKIDDLSNDEVFLGENVRQRLFLELGRHLPLLLDRPYKFIHIWRGPCWRCHAQRQVVVLCGSEGGEMWKNTLPPSLLAEMRKYARLERRTTSAVKEGYMANVCPSCGAVQGDWFLMEEFSEVAYDPDTIKTVLWVNKDVG